MEMKPSIASLGLLLVVAVASVSGDYINIEYPQGHKNFEIREVQMTQTVRSIKERIQKVIPGANPDQQRLYYFGDNLEDDQTLDYYGVFNSEFLMLVVVPKRDSSRAGLKGLIWPATAY